MCCLPHVSLAYVCRITSKGKRLSKIFVMQGGVPLLMHVMSIANVAVTAAEMELRGMYVRRCTMYGYGHQSHWLIPYMVYVCFMYGKSNLLIRIAMVQV